MGFEIDIPEDIGGTSAYLEVAGKYHATVSTMHVESMPNDQGEGDDGGFVKPLAGGFSCTLEVLGGEQANKKFSLIFWGPKFDQPDDSKGNTWSRKKQAAFAIACDLVKLDQLGTRATVNLEDAVGSQIVVEVEIEEYTKKDGKKGKKPQLVWANIYHVDDPRAKGAEMNAKLLATIAPAENRHKPEYFDVLTKKKSASASASSSTSRVTDADLCDI
ncbi:hypothetical protein SH449x_000777 [Pirellulaceae bacterium SH449]